MATVKTVTGKLTGFDGSNKNLGSVVILPSQQCTIPGTQELLPSRIPATVASDGTWSVSLYSTNDLTPTGTFYTVREDSPDGGHVELTIQVPQTAGPFVVTNITTTTPTASATPSHVSTLTVDGAATFTAGPVVIGTDPGGTQLLRVGGTGHFSGALTLDSTLGVTGLGTFSGGLTVSAGGVTITGNSTVVSTSATGPHLLIQGPAAVAGAIALRLLRPDTGDGIDLVPSNASGQTAITSRSTVSFLIDTGATAGLLIGVNNANSITIGGGGAAVKLGNTTGTLGFYGITGVVKATGTPAAATDLASVISLANSLRSTILGVGLAA